VCNLHVADYLMTFWKKFWQIILDLWRRYRFERLLVYIYSRIHKYTDGRSRKIIFKIWWKMIHPKHSVNV